MQITDADILIGIAGVIVAVSAAAALASLGRRRARATAVQMSRMDAHREWIRSVSNPPAESTGRHTLPDELLGGVTYRLSHDGLARARVPGTEPEA